MKRNLLTLSRIFSDSVTNISSQGVVSRIYTKPAHLIQILLYLRYNSIARYETLCDICCVDLLKQQGRFQLVYNLLSYDAQRRIDVVTIVSEHVMVPSAVSIYPAANWSEREIWDMFGVPFKNHPDLRRILTDYGFDGFPLRKDYPLVGYKELRYDDQQRQVVHEPVEVAQEFRSFDFQSAWK